MKPKEYAAEVVIRMTHESYVNNDDLRKLIFMLHSGIYIKDNLVYTVLYDVDLMDLARLKEEYSIDVEDSKVESYFNKVSKHFNKLIKKLLKEDNIEMIWAMKMVIYLKEYDLEYTGNYKAAYDIVKKFGYPLNWDNLLIELTGMAYIHHSTPEEFLNHLADILVKYDVLKK